MQKFPDEKRHHSTNEEIPSFFFFFFHFSVKTFFFADACTAGLNKTFLFICTRLSAAQKTTLYVHLTYLFNIHQVYGTAAEFQKVPCE